MPKDKDSTTAVITGSTGNAVQDMTPRSSVLGLATGITLAACVALGADNVVTGLATGIAANAAFLGWCLFDMVVKPNIT